MVRRIKLTTTLSVADLEQRDRRASEGMERSHWAGLVASRLEAAGTVLPLTCEDRLGEGDRARGSASVQ